MNKDELDQMVNRFLCWRLPDTFGPDCYITFDRDRAKANNGWPTGTNLLTGDEARAMLVHVLNASSSADTDRLSPNQPKGSPAPTLAGSGEQP